MSREQLPRRLVAERELQGLLGKGCAVVDVDGHSAYSIAISSEGVAVVVGDVGDDGSLLFEDVVDARLPIFGLGASRGAVRWLERASGTREYRPCDLFT